MVDLTTLVIGFFSFMLGIILAIMSFYIISIMATIKLINKKLLLMEQNLNPENLARQVLNTKIPMDDIPDELADEIISLSENFAKNKSKAESKNMEYFG